MNNCVLASEDLVFSSPITVLGLFPVFFLVLLVLFVPVFSVFVFIFVFVRICKQRGKKI